MGHPYLQVKRRERNKKLEKLFDCQSIQCRTSTQHHHFNWPARGMGWIKITELHHSLFTFYVSPKLDISDLKASEAQGSKIEAN